MKNTKQLGTIDSYIRNFPDDIQATLKKLRKAIKDLVPQAEETINYGIPTFKLNDKNLVHFAGFKKHIGFYPAPSAIEGFKKELTKYFAGKGSLRFEIDKPLPIALIKKIVRFRIKENIAKQKKK